MQPTTNAESHRYLVWKYDILVWYSDIYIPTILDIEIYHIQDLHMHAHFKQQKNCYHRINESQWQSMINNQAIKLTNTQFPKNQSKKRKATAMRAPDQISPTLCEHHSGYWFHSHQGYPWPGPVEIPSPPHCGSLKQLHPVVDDLSIRRWFSWS